MKLALGGLVLAVAIAVVAAACVVLGGPPLPLRTVAEIPLTGGTGRLDYESFDPQSNILYVAHLGAGAVIAVDTQRRRVLATIEGTPSVRGVLAVPQTRRVYAAAQGSGEVAVIDARAMRIMARVAAGDVDGLAFDPGTRRVFVSDERGGRDVAIDTRTNRVVARIDLGGEAGNTVYDPATGHVFVAVQTRNDLAEIEPDSARIVRRYPVSGCLHAHGLVVDPAEHAAYVACQINARLVRVDLRGGTARSAGVGIDPDVVALDPAAHRLYVASESGIVSIFDVAGGRLSKLGQSFYAPAAHVIGVDPVSHRVFIPLQNVNGRPVLRIAAPV